MLEKAIMFVGVGTNKYQLDKIVETSSLTEIESGYGADSCFYEACRIANIFGAQSLLFLNLNTWEDIKNHADEIKDLDLDILVPLDLLLDETYYDSYYDKEITYTQIILAILNETNTTVIMTGKHASLYEDLDQYLDGILDEDGNQLDGVDNEGELDRVENVKDYLANVNKSNLIYVTNNLEGLNYANAALASIICISDYAEYPLSSLLPDAIFDIDFSDISNELVFFKNNTLIGTTVENLVNFSDDTTTKIVTVQRILKYFHYHQPNIERYLGQTYAEYKKVEITEALQEYLDLLVDWIIYKYDIYSVTDISTQPGSVDIILKYDIWPKFTTEKYTIQTGG